MSADTGADVGADIVFDDGHRQHLQELARSYAALPSTQQIATTLAAAIAALDAQSAEIARLQRERDDRATPGVGEERPPIVVDLGEALRDTIAGIRDASPRVPGDADTDEIVAAVLPLLGRFLRDAAREHIAASRVSDDVDEHMTPTVRGVLAVKAAALTELADKTDPDRAADTAAVYR